MVYASWRVVPFDQFGDAVEQFASRLDEARQQLLVDVAEAFIFRRVAFTMTTIEQPPR